MRIQSINTATTNYKTQNVQFGKNIFKLLKDLFTPQHDEFVKTQDNATIYAASPSKRAANENLKSKFVSMNKLGLLIKDHDFDNAVYVYKDTKEPFTGKTSLSYGNLEEIYSIKDGKLKALLFRYKDSGQRIWSEKYDGGDIYYGKPSKLRRHIPINYQPSYDDFLNFRKTRAESFGPENFHISEN